MPDPSSPIVTVGIGGSVPLEVSGGAGEGAGEGAGGKD